ncbi:MAG: hypothetical protein KA408_15295 [Flavobacteriales bacterium]|nr:hypothetical protein [Flavobacteriales bacterium]
MINSAWSQNNVVRAYGGYANDLLYSVDTDPAGNIIVGGITGSFLVNTEQFAGWLMQLDANGDTLWSRSYLSDAEQTEFRHVMYTSDGGILATGFRFWQGGVVLKTDAFGIPEWTLGSNATRNFKTADATLEDGFYIAGSHNSGNNSNIDVFKVDDLGTLIWGVTFDTGYEDIVYDITTTPDSGAIVVGSTRSTGTYTDGLVFKLDKNGALEWNKAIGNQNPDRLDHVINLSQGGYLTVGRLAGQTTTAYRPLLVALNNSGDTTWTNIVGVGGGSSIIETSSGFVMTMDLVGGGQYSDHTLAFLTPTAQLVSTHTYGSTESEGSWNFKQLPDGRFVIVGITEGAGQGDTDGFISIVNGDGSSQCEGDPLPLGGFFNTPTLTTVGSITPSISLISGSLPTQALKHPLITDFCNTTNIERTNDEEAAILAHFDASLNSVVLTIPANIEQFKFVDIIDIIGRSVHTATINDCCTMVIPVAQLARGTYIIQVIDGRRDDRRSTRVVLN